MPPEPITLEEGRRILADLQRRAERVAFRLLGPGTGVVLWPIAEHATRVIREGLAKVDEITPTGHLGDKTAFTDSGTR